MKKEIVMNKIKLSQRIIGSFAIITGLIMLLGYSTVSEMGSVHNDFKNVVSVQMESIEKLKRVSDLYAINIVDASHQVRNNNFTWEEGVHYVEEARSGIKKEWDAYLSSHHTTQESKLIKEALYLMKSADENIAELLRIMKKKDKDVLVAFTIDRLYQSIDPITGKISEIIAENMKDVKSSYLVSNINYKDKLTFTYALVLFSIGLGLLLGYSLYKSITVPLKVFTEKLTSLHDHCITNFKQGIERMANGDLTLKVEPKTTPIETVREDEIGEVSKKFNDMLAKIQSALESYNQSREKITSAVNEIKLAINNLNDSSYKLTDNATTASVAVNEIASANEKLAFSASEAQEIMEKLSSSIHGVDDASKHQGSLVGTADRAIKEMIQDIQSVANSSRKAVEDAGDEDNSESQVFDEDMISIQDVRLLVSDSALKVRDLDEKGQQIGKIVNVIEQIAGQTNLLALNAAIEAARAGEQGKGFAVVADEVRHLAEQSASATKDIAKLIQSVRDTVSSAVSSIEKTDNGVQNVAKRVNQVRERAEHVLTDMGNVKEAAEKNESACVVMNKGSDQVSDSITNVAAISEETSASAQELTATGQELADSADKLKSIAVNLDEAISFFKISRGAA